MSALIKYRPEIDGLRAIAVMSVILFHFDPQFLPGGFTGVDVFFVLSGFLITGIMAKERALGTFSYKDFYIRRMKRILPPLYLVLFLTVIAGFFILVPNDFNYLKKSIERIVIFLSNVHFSKVGNYFAPAANEMPLLHTWSLAVEEQFYFIWPFLFGLVLLVRERLRFFLLVALLMSSYVYGEWALQGQENISFAYFSLATRFGELLVGAVTALFTLSGGLSSLINKKWASALMNFFGAALLVFSFLFLNEFSKFPGINAIPSTLGTALLIVGMSNPNVVTRMFSNSILVHLGKLSYSLYLFHWPVLAYMRYVSGKNHLSVSWLVVAAVLTYFSSILSFYLVETPSRKTTFKFSKALGVFFVIPTLALLMSLYVAQVALEKEDNPTFTKYGGDEICHGREVGDCRRGMLDRPARILVFGDSHAAHLNYFVDTLGKLNGWSAVVRSASSCGPAFGFDVNYLPQFSRNECAKLLESLKEQYENFDTIVISARWEYQLGYDEKDKSDPNFLNKLERTLKDFKNHGKKIYIVSQIPLLSMNPYRVEKAARLGIPVEASYNSDYKKANADMEKIAHKYNIHWVDLAALLVELPGGVYLEGANVYMDDNHLSQFGAKALAKKYFEVENKLQP